MTKFRPVLLSLTLAAALAGCAADPGPGRPATLPAPMAAAPGAAVPGAPGIPGSPATSSPVGPAAPPGSEPWEIRPARLRIYPATRFVVDHGQAVLEARVELLDDLGDSTKGVGHFRLELFAGGRAAQAHVARRLYLWDTPVLTREENRRYYDPITRAYLFRLKLDDLSPASQPVVLKVTFTPGAPAPARGAAAGRLEAEAGLSGPGLVHEDAGK